MFSSDAQKHGVIFLTVIALICLFAFPPLGIIIGLAALIMLGLNWIDVRTKRWLEGETKKKP